MRRNWEELAQAALCAPPEVFAYVNQSLNRRWSDLLLLISAYSLRHNQSKSKYCKQSIKILMQTIYQNVNTASNQSKFKLPQNICHMIVSFGWTFPPIQSRPAPGLPSMCPAAQSCSRHRHSIVWLNNANHAVQFHTNWEGNLWPASNKTAKENNNKIRE